MLCLSASRAEGFAWSGTWLAVCALGVAWFTRHRAAAQGHQGMWAIASLLVGVLHVLGAMFLVPSGCLSGALLERFVAAASPWLLAAAVFRTGVAPTERLGAPPEDDAP